MKKCLSVLLVILMLLSCAVLTTACDEGGSKRSKRDDDVEKYELVEIQFAGVTVEHYAYNYISFNFDDETYTLKNKVKANDIITKQTGTFSVDKDGNVTITNDDVPSQNYFLYSGEEVYFRGDRLHVEAYVPGYGDVYMIYEK